MIHVHDSLFRVAGERHGLGTPIRDQGVGGSNPLSPTKSFQVLIWSPARPPGLTSGGLVRRLLGH